MVILSPSVKVAPSEGLVILTVGGVLPPLLLTVTETALDVVVAPSLSVATAVSEYDPAETLLQVTL